MSAFIQLLIISVSLAADALSVSIAGGMRSQKSRILHAVKVAAFFGIFQLVMPLFGWMIGELLKGFIVEIDHWIAFGLLSLIGIKMIYESLNNEPGEERKNILNNKVLIMLSVATSIDAFVVGITLRLLQIPILISVIVIGIITFVLCFFCFLLGKKLGVFFGKEIEIVGGVALIFLGFKILVEHLIG